MGLTGGQTSFSQLFPGPILECHHQRFDADPNTPSITHFQGRAVAVLQEVLFSNFFILVRRMGILHALASPYASHTCTPISLHGPFTA